MGRKKPRKRRRGRASGNGAMRRGLPIYQKGGQIRTLTGNRRDAASRGAGGAWYRASFAGGSTARERPYRTTEKGRRHAAAVGHALLVQPVHGGGITVGEREPAWMAGWSGPRLGRMPRRRARRTPGRRD